MIDDTEVKLNVKYSINSQYSVNADEDILDDKETPNGPTFGQDLNQIHEESEYESTDDDASSLVLTTQPTVTDTMILSRQELLAEVKREV